MECQVDKNEHFRHHLLFAFNRGAKATEAAREICAVYGEGAIAERTARYWFAKFKSGNFDLKDASRSGRPSEFDEVRLDQLLHEAAQRKGSNKSTVAEHLHGRFKNSELGCRTY
ncbi:hypothetical protein ACJJTC_014046 [Scirpophaga incertulas]